MAGEGRLRGAGGGPSVLRGFYFLDLIPSGGVCFSPDVEIQWGKGCCLKKEKINRKKGEETRLRWAFYLLNVHIEALSYIQY